jgi:hypothetical protein
MFKYLNIKTLFLLIIINVIISKSLHLNKRSIDKNSKQYLFTFETTTNESSNRWKRSANNSLSSSIKSSSDELSSFVSSFALNDSHEQLTVHWSGKGSDVIICLAKNRPNNANQSSAVYISHDYGKNFAKISSFVLKNGSNAVINTFYISQAINSHYIFVDNYNNCIFVTKDYGKSFRRIDLSFSPQTISMHSTNADLVLISSLPNKYLII